MKQYFEKLGLGILKELWNPTTNDIISGFPDLTDKLLAKHFPIRIEHTHVYKLKPWRMTLKPGWDINVGVFQVNSKYEFEVGEKGYQRVIPKHIKEITSARVLGGKRDFIKDLGMDIRDVPLDSLLIHGDIKKFSELMLEKFKKEIEDHVRKMISVKYLRRQGKNNIPTYIILWKPSISAYRRMNNNRDIGPWKDKNFLMNVYMRIFNITGEWMGSFNCWDRDEKIVRVIPETYPERVGDKLLDFLRYNF